MGRHAEKQCGEWQYLERVEPFQDRATFRERINRRRDGLIVVEAYVGVAEILPKIGEQGCVRMKTGG